MILQMKQREPISHIQDLSKLPLNLKSIPPQSTSVYLRPSSRFVLCSWIRIGEEDVLDAWSYHRPDSLGSVRQVTDSASEVEFT